MGNHNRFLSWMLAVLLVATLTACGGGGGGGGGSGSVGGGSGGGAGEGDGELDVGPKPAKGVATYDGNREAAELDEVSAVEHIRWISNLQWLSTIVMFDPVNLRFDEATTFEQTVEGPDGGSAVIKGSFDARNLGWYTIEYQDYVQNQITANGKILIDIVGGNSETGWSTYISFYSFHRAVGENAIETNGYVHRHTNGENTTYTLYSSVAFGGFSVFYDGTVIKTSEALRDPVFALTLTGTIYHSSVGRVDIQRLEDYKSDAVSAPRSTLITTDVLEASFAEGRAMRLHQLENPQLTGVELDLDGDGTFDKGRRVTMDELFYGVDMTASMQAGDLRVTAGNRRLINPYSNVESGLFSDSGDGAFLTYRWRLLSSSPRDELSNADQPVPLIDHQPVALLELTVSDGVNERRDVVDVISHHHLENPDAGINFRLGGLNSSAIGEKVWLDGRNFTRIDQSGEWQWNLVAPEGSTATIADSNALTTSFVPDIAGTYRVEVVSLGAKWDEPRFTVAEVQAGLPYEIIGAWGSWQPYVLDGISADFNADGMTDYLKVIGSYSGGNATAMYRLNDGSGVLEQHDVYQEVLPFPSSDRIVAADVNGDGRPEVVNFHDGDVHVVSFINDGNGGLATSYVTHADVGGCTLGAISGDINGDGKDDVLVHDSCGTARVMLGSAGGLNAPSADVASGTKGVPYLRDINGDDKLDLAVYNYNFSLNPTLTIFEGNGDGTFADGYTLNPHGVCSTEIHFGQFDDDAALELLTCPDDALAIVDILPDRSLVEIRRWNGFDTSLVVADFNADGRDDIFAGAGNSTSQRSFVAFMLSKGEADWHEPAYKEGPVRPRYDYSFYPSDFYVVDIFNDGRKAVTGMGTFFVDPL